MHEKIKDKQYVMGFTWAGYRNGKRFPILVNTFSDDYKNEKDSIEILGEKFQKKYTIHPSLAAKKLLKGMI